MKHSATVVAVYRRRYDVETDDGGLFTCVTRGRRHDVVCGDRVEIAAGEGEEGVIERVLPRRNYLERSDAWKRKGIAANVDQVLVLAAVEPRAAEAFMSRVLLLAHAADIPALIALNKTDLAGAAAARARLAMFAAAGYDILELRACPGDGGAPDITASLRERLHGRCTVLLGQSGVGKSSLVNALVPAADVVTGALSVGQKSGRHTTTFSRRYRIDAASTLIDCPGMQEVGIHHLTLRELENGFVEFAPWLGHCRYANCRHSHEPGCPVREQAAAGKIDRERLALFQKLVGEIAA